MADGDNTATSAMDPNSLAALLQQTLAGGGQQPSVNVGTFPSADTTPPGPSELDKAIASKPDIPFTAGQSAPPQAQTQAAAQALRMGGMPLIAQYIQGMIQGQQRQMGPNGATLSPSRGDMTLNFLGQFLGNLAQGLSQAGHGPGANLRGFGAAVQAPYQRSLQDFQVQQAEQQHQAQIQAEQARTSQIEAQTRLLGQSVPVTLPNGQQIFLPASQAGQAIGQINRGAAAAGITAQAKLTSDQMKLMAATGQISRLVPAVDAQGNKVMRALNKYGKPIGDVDGAIPPSSYLGKTTDKTKFIQNVDGTWEQVPYQETTRPNIPGKGGGGTGAGAAKPVIGADGEPLSGLASQQARSRAAAADSVNQLIPRIRELVQQHRDQLGPVMGRGQKIALKAGAASGPWVNELNGALTSLYSFAGTMHGWRALQVEDAFRKQYGGLEQSPDNFMGSLDAMKNTADAVIKSGTTRIGAPAKGGSKVDDLVNKYGAKP